MLTLRWQQGATVLAWPFTNVAILPFGAFPLGVWGPPQSADAPQVPKGEVVQALNQVLITARATESPGGPAISYNRLDPPGPRRPLPFLRNSGRDSPGRGGRRQAAGRPRRFGGRAAAT